MTTTTPTTTVARDARDLASRASSETPAGDASASVAD
ncbi:hypothetical protein FB463_002242 [Frigoribacterium faeni]|uniref:Uncharacterized protein n=1 Tax=Frigoribacterium faeni TaxID=145483 RepID=A0A7W3JJI4_9MICO|nr:hypothetical protein [Frigoribacterium faeni]